MMMVNGYNEKKGMARSRVMETWLFLLETLTTTTTTTTIYDTHTNKSRSLKRDERGIKLTGMGLRQRQLEIRSKQMDCENTRSTPAALFFHLSPLFSSLYIYIKLTHTFTPPHFKYSPRACQPIPKSQSEYR